MYFLDIKLISVNCLFIFCHFVSIAIGSGNYNFVLKQPCQLIGIVGIINFSYFFIFKFQHVVVIIGKTDISL